MEKLAGKPEKDVPVRDLQPSGMPGGDINAELIDCGVPITATGDYDAAALGTCVHDIFCVADNKTDAQVADMVKAYGFENNLKDSDQIKKSWESLTEWLMKKYGPDKKQYHELPFKHQLPNGQIVTGSMDFVWETAEGCVVVDYKTTNNVQQFSHIFIFTVLYEYFLCSAGTEFVLLVLR